MKMMIELGRLELRLLRKKWEKLREKIFLITIRKIAEEVDISYISNLIQNS